MGDENFEFQKVHATFRPRIHRYLTRLVGEAEAEDLTQEVFVKVSQALDHFRGEAKLSTWLYRIATNAGIDRLRSPSFRLSTQVGSSMDLIEIDAREPGAPDVWKEERSPSVEDRVWRSQMNECIREFIGELPENYRTVLVLAELEGFRDQEVADILGLTLGTVKIRLHRARNKLKEALRTGCDAYWVENNEFLPDLSSALGEYRKIS